MDNVMEDLKEDRRNYRKLPVSLGLTVNLGYLPADCPTFNALVNTTEDRLLSSVIRNSYHVIRPLFPHIITRRPGVRKRAHPFTLPLQDDKQCIPRVLFKTLLPPAQP